MSAHPIRDGSSGFYDDPSDIGFHLRDNAIHNIEAGQRYITDVTLRYLEDEAIARFAKQTNRRPEREHDKRTDRDMWRATWTIEARFASQHMSNHNALAQAAIRVLLTASDLRAAIEENSDPQMIAAQSMLLACEVFMGGYMMDAEALRKTLAVVDEAKKSAYLKGAGRQAKDLAAAKTACATWAAELWKATPPPSIGEVAEECRRRLVDRKDKLPTLESFPKVPTIKTWLKEASKAGKLVIPDGTQSPGRRRKPPG